MVLRADNSPLVGAPASGTGAKMARKEGPKTRVRVTSAFYFEGTLLSRGQVVDLPEIIAREVVAANKAVVEQPPVLAPAPPITPPKRAGSAPRMIAPAKD
jgi:hypothetical protein